MISKNQIKQIRQLEQKKFRRRDGLFVAEGPKVVGDLLRRYQPHAIFATAEWLSANKSVTTKADGSGLIQEISEEELGRTSFLQHPQQVVALFPIPSQQAAPPTPAVLSLALDGVQDPGNLGTIIRIADWFGISDIYCSEDTADAWNPKVVQATMGSIARVNLTYCDLPALLASLPTGFPVYGTLLDGNDIYQQELTPGGIIVMGNEGNGISPEVRQLVNRRLLIPDFHQGTERAESLNVAIATAITCSEFRRRSR